MVWDEISHLGQEHNVEINLKWHKITNKREEKKKTV